MLFAGLLHKPANLDILVYIQQITMNIPQLDYLMLGQKM